MEVDKKLYEDIKAYCELNGIKPRDYVNTLLKKAFMEDKYGKHPFQTQRDEEAGRVTTHNISDVVIETQMKELVSEMKSGDSEFSEFVDNIGGPQAYKNVVDECIFGENGAKNEKPEAPEALRDTDRDNVSRNETGNVTKKPKKRTINVK